MNATVLVVDDEVIVAEGIRMLLRDMGYAVPQVALSAHEALAAVEADRPDILLMDVNLGGTRDGIEAAKAVRTRFDLPVVFVTAYSDRVTMEEAKLARPYGYVVKPVERQDLQAAVEMALHSHQQQLLIARRERELQAAAERLKAVVDATGSATWEWNVQSGAVVFSPRWAEMVGYTLEELAPLSILTWERLSHPEDLVRSQEALDRCFRRESAAYDCECRMRHKDGSWIWVLDRGTVVEWTDDGRPLRMVGAHLDITSHKREAQIRLDLERQARLAQKSESLAVLAGGVAHHLNNLLMAVMGNAEVALQDLPESGPGTDSLREIQAAAASGAQLARRILAYTGRVGGMRTVIDLNETVRHVVPMLCAAVSPAAGVGLVLGRSLPRIEGDGSQIGQVLTALLTNAIEATEARGAVTVATGTGVLPSREAVDALVDHGLGIEPSVFLAVSDDGPGILPANMERLFDPFFSTKMIGRGLGLAAVRGIVQSHRGAIDVRSAPGRGTTVRIWFQPAQDGDLHE